MDYSITDIVNVGTFKLYKVWDMRKNISSYYNREQTKEIVRIHMGNAYLDNNAIKVDTVKEVDLFDYRNNESKILTEAIMDNLVEIQARFGNLVSIGLAGEYKIIIPRSNKICIDGLEILSNRLARPVTKIDNRLVYCKEVPYIVVIADSVYYGNKTQIIKSIKRKYRA